MSSQPSRHAVIVGAGPAGAVLGNLLATRGVRVTLLERQSDFAREFRGEALMPSGLDAFRQMGLAADFDGLAQARPRRLRLHMNGVFLAELATEELTGRSSTGGGSGWVMGG